MTPETQELILQEQRRILRGLPGGPGVPGVVQEIQQGAGVSIDNSNPARPVISVTQPPGGGIQSVRPGVGISVDNVDPLNPLVSVTGGGGPGNPNVIAKSFNLAGITPVEVLRIPCPPGMGWNFSLSLGTGDINSTPAVLQGGTGAFFNEGGTFVYDGDWDYHWAVEAPSPFRFGTLDLTADPVIDGTFMRAAQVGNELVISCVPDNALAIGPCAILFEGTRSDGSGFAPSAPAPVAALDTLAVVRLAGLANIPADPGVGFFAIPFDVVEQNAGGHYNSGDRKYTAPATGIYSFAGSANFSGLDGGQLVLRKNGTVLRSVSGGGGPVWVELLFAVTAGDLIEVGIAYVSSDGSANVGDTLDLGTTALNIVQLVDSAAGALPDDAAKMLQTLQLAAPNWFSPPNLANSGLDVLASSNRTVNVDLWMFQPWQSALVIWGDGQFSQIYLDSAINPVPRGGQGTAAFSGLGVEHVYAADGTYQLEVIVVNAYGQDNYQEQFVFEPV